MKKHILIPVLLAPTLLASTCLSSCSNLNEYQVTNDEFEKIIALEDVQFMQIHFLNYNQDGSIWRNWKQIFSPTVFYNKNIKDEPSYEERYVMKHNLDDQITYTMIERFSSEGQWSDEQETSESSFELPKYHGNAFVDIYEKAKRLNQFDYDPVKKCYFAWSIENEADDKNEVEFYFYKKQLMQFKIFTNDILEADITLKYEQDTPVPPTPSN